MSGYRRDVACYVSLAAGKDVASNVSTIYGLE
jgi:hypothetical protein